MNNTDSLREGVSHLDTLPAIPRIAREILALKLVTEEGERALLALVEQDPLLSAKIIGLSNAPLFGAAHNIMTVREAIAVLGLKRIKMIALGFAMMSSMGQRPAGLLDVQQLWQHSLAIAMAMHTLAEAMPRNVRPQDDEIFLAGLLHDIGFLVLDHIDPELSDKFFARLAAQADCPLEQIEAEMLEVGHSELGAELGRHWNLPDAIVAVLRYHHSPRDARADIGQPLVAMASLAEKLLPSSGLHEHVNTDIDEMEWRALGIDPSRAEEIRERILRHA